MTVETLGALGKDGMLVIAVIYLWRRVENVTDAYLSSTKETAKIVADNTVATNSHAQAMNALTIAINRITDKGQ